MMSNARCSTRRLTDPAFKMAAPLIGLMARSAALLSMATRASSRNSVNDGQRPRA